MVRAQYSEKTRGDALRYIQEGKTYAEIGGLLGIPKSTLSVWRSNVGTVRDRSRQLKHLHKARIKAVEVIRAKKEGRLRQAQRSASAIVRSIDLTNEPICKSFLAMLYWAEGGKQDGNLKFTNTDSDLVALFVRLLRAHYPIEESRFRVALQVHSYHDQNSVCNFWSQRLDIPASQFWKIYVKPRGGKRSYRRNSHGICNVHYSSSSIQRELLALGRQIAEHTFMLETVRN